MSADLLAALLAVRNGLLSAPAALECAATAPEGGGFLAAALKRGADTGLLRRLVDAQLGRHGGDAAKAAAAVGGDAGLRAELSKRLSAAPAAAPESRPSRYLLGDELGRGGLGRVVSAFDAALDREVAVKLVIDNVTPALLERFGREAKLTARLDHPNVVPVHDFGELTGADGKRQVFLSMKRIHGRDLGTLLNMIRKGEGSARDSWSRARLLGVFQGICHGVAYAHSKGIIHRDLKPANVMIGEFGETLVVDWGLAKIVGSGDARGTWRQGQATLVARRPEGSAAVRASGLPPATDITMDGEVLGTPAYMPPEQAEGRLGDMDARSDIWSLGAILFEILTLRPAFDGASAQEVMEKVSRHDLAPPSRFADVPAELDAIVLRAMAKIPGDRYATALQLSNEVQLFLEGVKERDRARREARDRAAEGDRALQRFRELRDRIAAQEREVGALAARIKPHVEAAGKASLWEAEDRLRALGDERLQAYSQAAFSFSQALAADPSCEPASDGICELFLMRGLEAEQARNREESVLQQSLLERYDRTGRFRARLAAPGRFEVRVRAWDCDCLKPVTAPGWRPEWTRETPVPWREGRPRPDLPLTDDDRPVPALRGGAGWGHGPGCRFRDLRDVEVRLARLEHKDRLLVPVEERVLGRTPVDPVQLPQGRYLCRLRFDWPGGEVTDQALPFRIDRGATWSQDVTLYPPSRVPKGMCVVPGGPFVFGGSHAGGMTEEPRETRDLFVGRFAVRMSEYLEFVEDVLRTAGREAAAEIAPWGLYDVADPAQRDGPRLVPSSTPSDAYLLQPDAPAHSMRWMAALAYAEWRSKRDGVVYTLLHEEEHEKAARGPDRRRLSGGDFEDASYYHCDQSLAGVARPMPVDSFPRDESPYGVRGLTGGIRAWCLNAPERNFRPLRALRGGCWTVRLPDCLAAHRWALDTTVCVRDTGIRLACRPFAWPV